MARAPRLKVYRARMGFFDSIVAAPSQKAALEAWGTRQDLFHESMASLTEDPLAVEAALANPGVVLQRPLDSAGAFEAPSTTAALPTVAPAPRKRPKAAPSRPPADRTALIAAERALAHLDVEETSERDALDRARRELETQRRALDARELDLRRDFARRRGELQANLERVRKAYQKAGGAP